MVRTYSADDPAADLPLTPDEQAFADEADRIRERNRKDVLQGSENGGESCSGTGTGSEC